MKEYYGDISFSGRISFGVRAENEEEAKNKLYENIGLIIKSEDEQALDISEVNWDLITWAPRGNMATPFVLDFELFEERD